MDENLPTYPTPDEERIEQPTVEVLPSVDIDDNDLVAVINRKEAEAQQYTKNVLKLPERVKTNNNFWIGKQFDEGAFENWQVPYKDNLIWQDTETRIALAASRMPDIILTPADVNDVKKKEATKTLQRGLDIRFKTDTIKRLIKNGLRHNHLDFIGILKCVWNKEKDDYEYVTVRPDRMILDHTATIPEDGFTADNMDFISEVIEEPLAVIAAKFPGKKDELYAAVGITRGTSRQLMRKYKYKEIWMSWWDAQGKKQEIVCHKYQNLILDKGKDPYWDYTGYEKTTDRIDETTGFNKTETLFHNHLPFPRKPYILFSHTNLGKDPYEDTTPVEQAIPLQKFANKVGRQIAEISARAVPKIGFSGKFITKEEARRVTNDPDENIWLKDADDIRQAISVIPASPPSMVLSQELTSTRSQIDSKFSTHSTTRGERIAQESGISKQITREGDLSISDDIVSICVERVVYEMANWAVQMIKLNYDKAHYVRDVGPDGEAVQLELSRDKIDDGIAVNVKASSVDKSERRAIALQLASRKGIDPFSLAEDLDLSNPKERTKRLILFSTNDFPAYFKELGIDMPVQGGAGGSDVEQAQVDIQRLMGGEDVQPPEQLSTDYVNTIRGFVNSPEFPAQDPTVQERIKSFIGLMRQKLSNPQNTPQSPLPAQPPALTSPI